MTWVAVGAAGIAAVGVIGGSAMQSDAAKGAANTQAAGSRAATDEQRREFGITQVQTGPYRESGNDALRLLSGGLGFTVGDTTPTSGQVSREDFDAQAYLKANPDVARDTSNYALDPYRHYVEHGMGEGRQAYVTKQGTQADAATAPLTRKFSVSDFWNDPVVQLGYQSGLDLGTKALKNAAPLTTGLDSGAALKELTQFGTDYTGRTMAAPAEARFVANQGNVFNKLAAMAGIGQTAVGTDTTAGMNAANNTSNIIGANANAQGAAKIASANTFSGGLNSISNYWQQQQMLDRMDKGRNTSATGYTPMQSSDWYAG